MNKLNQA